MTRGDALIDLVQWRDDHIARSRLYWERRYFERRANMFPNERDNIAALLAKSSVCDGSPPPLQLSYSLDHP